MFINLLPHNSNIWFIFFFLGTWLKWILLHGRPTFWCLPDSRTLICTPDAYSARSCSSSSTRAPIRYLEHAFLKVVLLFSDNGREIKACGQNWVMQNLNNSANVTWRCFKKKTRTQIITVVVSGVCDMTQVSQVAPGSELWSQDATCPAGDGPARLLSVDRTR